MLDQTPKLPTAALQIPTPNARKQRRKMVLALILLLSALVIIVVKDAPNWFGSSDSQAADLDSGDSSSAGAGSHSRKANKATTPPPAKTIARPAIKASTNQASPPAVVNRTALPPLEIEVVAGDSHKIVRPGSDAVKVELPADTAASSSTEVPAFASTNAAERVHMSADTTHIVQRPVQPSYPMLARQMKVQGAVVLQALIGADGVIQDLHVLSGPTILASAAQEAVRQWRFKPYLQNGAPVETQANITVNFTISTL